MPVDDDLVMEVRTRGEAGLAEVAHHLALAHPHAVGDAAREAGHVRIGGDVAVGVLDLDAVAVGGRALRLEHCARARGQDRRADGRRPVDAGVGPRIAQDGVEAQPEARRHRGVGHRGAHQELAHRTAVLVVEVDSVVVGRDEAIIAERLVLHFDRG